MWYKYEHWVGAQVFFSNGQVDGQGLRNGQVLFNVARGLLGWNSKGWWPKSTHWGGGPLGHIVSGYISCHPGKWSCMNIVVY